MIIGSASNHLELVVEAIEPADQPRAGDLRVSVALRIADFSGRCRDVFIDAYVWRDFRAALQALSKGYGEAELRSLSPHELHLRIRSIDRAGHLMADGHIGTVRYLHRSAVEIRLTYAFDLDRELLLGIVESVDAISGG